MRRGAAPSVYFPIEITSREYLGNLVTAVELASRGLTCVVGFKSAVQAVMAAATSSGVLFYKGGDTGHWRNSSRHALVGLDPEAGIAYRDFSDFWQLRPALHSMTTTVVQFCYGRDDYEFFTRKFLDFPDKFYMTGAPRVSLWGPAGSALYERDVARIRNKYGRVVLFASSGGFAHERYIKQGQTASAAWQASDAVHHFLGIAREFAMSEPTTSVILRPHPSDSWTAWRDAVKDISNLSVESAFDLSAWIRTASLIVHPGTSTAAFEALCVGVPALSTASNAKPNAAADLSYTANTAQEVLEYHHRSQGLGFSATPSTAAEALLRRKLLHPIEGAPQRVADVLLDVFDFSGHTGLPRPRRLADFRRKVTRQADGSSLGGDTPPPFKRDPLTSDRVAHDVEAARNLLGLGQDFAVDELGPNCFCISSAR